MGGSARMNGCPTGDAFQLIVCKFIPLRHTQLRIHTASLNLEKLVNVGSLRCSEVCDGDET